MAIRYTEIVGVILAGGQSSRMDYRDKALLTLGERPVISYVIENARPQVSRLLINANRHQQKFADFGLPVLSDGYGPAAGPLAGILTAMEYCRKADIPAQAVACFPADSPWFPLDIVKRLAMSLLHENCQVSCIKHDTQWQPLFSLWDMSLAPVVRQAIAENCYSPLALMQSLPHGVVCLSDLSSEQFSNLNTPQDLQGAEEMLRKMARLGAADPEAGFE